MNSRGQALRNYVIRRLLLMVPTMLGVTLAVFILTHFVPGGPIEQYLMELAGAGDGGEGGGGSGSGSGFEISDQNLQTLREYYGFDKPVVVRFLEYLRNLVFLDLGKSFRYAIPVTDIIGQRLPVSLYYGVVTTVLTYLICIPLGMVKAIQHKTWIDNVTSIVVFIGYAIPGFALGALMLVLFAVRLQWFPIGGFRSPNYEDLSQWENVKDVVHHSILPLIAWMSGSLAVMTMLMKNSLIENMSADFVKTALASGLSWQRAVFVHAARNSLIPLATSFGNNIALVLAGSLLIERVFNIPGMGLLFFESIQARDYPVVLGLVVIGSFLLVLGNLLSDLCVALVDPRVRFQ
ncbi:MAG: ABC transporter permease [Candidatus Sumerlaeia bacterium]|nr:ABC transporter permease [Candidatus Sumerlaeia bacterium]